MSIPGGTTQAKAVDDRVQQICQDIQPKVEEKLNRKLEVFVPVLYKSQVVAGMNYFIKVKIGEGNHLHIRVYKPLQGELQLSGVQENKLEDDEIAYF